MNKYSDIELLEMFGGSQKLKALEVIYERYSHLVYGVCLKYLNSRDESLDATVEVFEIILKKIPEQSITNFSSWLYSVSKNHCLMTLRKNKKQQEVLNKIYLENDDSTNSDSMDQETQNYQQLESAMIQLSNEQKICIQMFYYNRKSYVEISEETGFPVKLVKSHLQNGRNKLKKIINE